MTSIARALLLTLLLTGSLFPQIGPVKLSTIMAVVAAPVVVYELARPLPRIHPAAGLAVPLFLILVLPTIVMPPASEYGQEKLLHLITSTFLSALAAALIRDRDDLVTLAKVWVGAGAVLALATIVGAGTSARVVAFVGSAESNPIWLSRAMATAVIFAVWLMLYRTGPRRLVLSGATVIILWGMILTGSRGPLAGLAVGLGVVVLFGREQRLKRVLTAATLGAVGVYFLLVSQPKSRIAQLLLDPSSDVTGAIRQAMWSRSFELIGEHPGGVGVGNWGPLAGMPPHIYPHSLFLEVAVELGVLVGLIFVGVTVWVLVRLARRGGGSASARIVLAALAAETVAVSVSGDMNARTFFALLTLGYVVCRWPAPPAGVRRGSAQQFAGRPSTR